MDENTSYKNVIKEHMKESVLSDRRIHRDQIINKRRGILGGISINNDIFIKPQEIKHIALRIKHKGNVTERNLKLLIRAFIQNENNIIAFANTDGALHSLIRELTGTDSAHQLLAAECCVNLALGNPKCCMKVAKCAGPYLITYLQGMSIPLMNTVSWALGNLAGSDVKTLELLKSQGLMESLLEVIEVEGVQPNVIYALIHFVKIGLPVLQPADFKKIASRIVQLPNKSPDAFWLLYLLSCSNDCDEILLLMLQPCLEVLAEPNIHSLECIKTKTASARILANLTAANFEEAAFLLLSDFDSLFPIMERILMNGSHPHICRDIMWLFGNLFNHPSESVQNHVRLNMIKFKHLELLCIPLLNELMS